VQAPFARRVRDLHGLGLRARVAAADASECRRHGSIIVMSETACN